MKKKYTIALFLLISIPLFAQNKISSLIDDNLWQKEFFVKPSNFSSTGTNNYFILQPGYQLILAGEEDNSKVLLTITVLNQTKLVDGVETRIVEEKEERNGIVSEISRNYFVIDSLTNDVYYYGEQVDIYKDGKIKSNEGSWEACINGAKYGLLMPGKIKAGQRFYQEVAPNVAMDRSEIISNKITSKTPAGKFVLCLKTKETTPLEPNVEEYKIYAPGIGLIKDGSLLLIKYGYLNNK